MMPNNEFDDEEEEDRYSGTDESAEEVYSEEGREKLVEDDAMSPWEDAFMDGAEEGGKNAKCRHCGKVLYREMSIVEKAVGKDLYRFCSDECLEKYEEEHED